MPKRKSKPKSTTARVRKRAAAAKPRAAVPTGDARARFLDLIRAGNRVDVACQLSGLVRSTHYLRVETGRDALAKEPGARTPHEAECADYAADYDRACAELEEAWLERAVHGGKVARGYQWGLEQRFPDVYKRRTATTVSGPDGGPVPVAMTVDAAALHRRLQERRARRGGGADGGGAGGAAGG